MDNTQSTQNPPALPGQGPTGNSIPQNALALSATTTPQAAPQSVWDNLETHGPALPHAPARPHVPNPLALPWDSLRDAEKINSLLRRSNAPLAGYLMYQYGIHESRPAMYSGRVCHTYADRTSWLSWGPVRHEVTRSPAVNPTQDTTIIEVIENAETYAKDLCDAIRNVTDVLDNPGSRDIALVKGDTFDDEYIYSTARNILIELILRCIWGFRCHRRLDKATDADMHLNCIDRLMATINALREAKTVCRDVLQEDTRIATLVHAPLEIKTKKVAQKRTNNTKKDTYQSNKRIADEVKARGSLSAAAGAAAPSDATTSASAPTAKGKRTKRAPATSQSAAHPANPAQATGSSQQPTSNAAPGTTQAVKSSGTPAQTVSQSGVLTQGTHGPLPRAALADVPDTSGTRGQSSNVQAAEITAPTTTGSENVQTPMDQAQTNQLAKRKRTDDENESPEAPLRKTAKLDGSQQRATASGQTGETVQPLILGRIAQRRAQAASSRRAARPTGGANPQVPQPYDSDPTANGTSSSIQNCPYPGYAPAGSIGQPRQPNISTAPAPQPYSNIDPALMGLAPGQVPDTIPLAPAHEEHHQPGPVNPPSQTVLAPFQGHVQQPAPAPTVLTAENIQRWNDQFEEPLEYIQGHVQQAAPASTPLTAENVQRWNDQFAEPLEHFQKGIGPLNWVIENKLLLKALSTPDEKKTQEQRELIERKRAEFAAAAAADPASY